MFFQLDHNIGCIGTQLSVNKYLPVMLPTLDDVAIQVGSRISTNFKHQLSSSKELWNKCIGQGSTTEKQRLRGYTHRNTHIPKYTYKHIYIGNKYIL